MASISRRHASIWHASVALATIAGSCAAALAQSTAPAGPGPAPSPTAAAPATPAPTQTQVVRSSGIPQRDTLLRLMKPISIDFNETRVEDALRFVTDVTGADIEPMWMDDRNTSGLNKDTVLTFSVKNATALDVIEKIIEKIPSDEMGLGGGSWQMSSSGSIQIGPKERLNRFKRVEIYPIRDLLIDLPDYTDAPTMDLNNLLQQGGTQGGGGGAQSPFEEQNNERERRSLEERANELVDILTQLVESEQWVQNGGDGGTMRVWRDSLIVNAPDYMHRGLNGYSYWPNGTRVIQNPGQRRYVTLGVDTSIGTIDDIRKVPVTAVTPGGLTPSNPGPNGRATPAPAAPTPAPATPAKP